MFIPDSRHADQFVEMRRFDGTGDLELFLQRFRILADYYRWSNSEQLFRLKNCIQVGQVSDGKAWRVY